MGVNALEVRRRVMMAQPHRATATGAIASFRTDVISPLKMSFDLLPIQTGEGDPSPENVRPITGHDGFTRIRTGKNLFGGELLRDGIKASMPSAVDDAENRTITFYANATVVQNITEECGLSGRFKENTQYTIVITGNNSSASSVSTNLRVNYTDGTNANLSFPEYGKKTTLIFTTQENKTLYSLSKRNASSRTIIYYDESGIFEGTLTEADFEAYNGTSIETTFPTPPGTVYGGHVVDNGDGTGTLTVDRAVVDLSSISWTKYKTQANPDATVFTADDSVPFVGWGSIADKTKCISNALAPTDTGEFATSKTNAFWWNTARTGYRIVWGQPNGGSSKAELEQFLEDNSVVVIGPLAEPVQYTLSLTALQSLIGQNHVWVDNADSVSVEYWGH